MDINKTIIDVNKKIQKFVNIIIEYFQYLKHLNRLIIIIVMFIVLFFCVVVYKLTSGSLNLSEVISALIIALSSLLASAVAITNMRQNFIIESSKNLGEDIANLKFLSFNIVKMIYHLKLLKGSINNKEAKHISEFSSFKDVELVFRETIMKKEVIIMLQYEVINKTVFDILFTFNIIDKYVNTILIKFFEDSLVSNVDLTLLGDVGNTAIDNSIQKLQELDKYVNITMQMAAKKYDAYIAQGESY